MEKLIIISSFSDPTEISGKGGGGMTYNTFNTAKFLKANHPNLDVEILCEKDVRFKDNYTIDSINIKRIYKYNDLLIGFKLYRRLRKEGNNSKVLLEFEFNSFGGILTNISLILGIFLIKRKLKIYSVLHQVINNIDSLKEHLGIYNKFKLKFFSFGIRKYTKALSKLSSKVIVFDEVLKNRLRNLGINAESVEVFPHGVIVNEKLSKTDACQKLNLNTQRFRIIIFGYIAWYKGTDWIINFASINPEIELIIAGGESATQSKQTTYKKFIESSKKIAEKIPNVKITGFIKYQDIPLYFNSADLAVFPYRVLMSSSGPLSWAISTETPFLLSEALEPYTETFDFKEAKSDLNLSFKMISYADLQIKVNKFQTDSTYRNNLIEVSKKLKKSRNWSTVAENYYRLLFEKTKEPNKK